MYSTQLDVDASGLMIRVTSAAAVAPENDAVTLWILAIPPAPGSPMVMVADSFAAP